MDAIQFMNFCNSTQSSGYVKHWKSVGILYVVEDIMKRDYTRQDIFDYVLNCLAMEGFTISACETITDYLIENMKETA